MLRPLQVRWSVRVLPLAAVVLAAAGRAAPADCHGTNPENMECAPGQIVSAQTYQLCTASFPVQYGACGGVGVLGSEGQALGAQSCATDLITGCPGSTTDPAAWQTLGTGSTLSAPACGGGFNAIRVLTLGGVEKDNFAQLVTHAITKVSGQCTGSAQGGQWLWRHQDVICPATFVPYVYDNPGDADCRRCPPGTVWSNGTDCISFAQCLAGPVTQPYLGQCVQRPQDKGYGKGCADCQVGDPFDPTFSGIHTEQQRIVSTPTLGLTLVYNSYVNGRYRAPQPFPFGVGWWSSYSQRVLTTLGGYVVGVVRPRGQTWSFNAPDAGTVFTGDPDVPDKLEEVLDGSNVLVGYRYTVAADDSVELFDVSGNLTSITDRAGLATTFTYSTASTPVAIAPRAGLMIGASDQFGRSISFTYDAASRVVTMTDVLGKTYGFAYDEATANVSPAQSNLTSVTFPDGTKRKYVYNEKANTQNAQLNNTLTGLIDETGTRAVTWTYESSGRILSSQRAGGVDTTSQVYNPDVTVSVTGPNGAVRTYASQTIQGVWKVNAITGPPCPECGPAAQTLNSGGFVTSRTDWNGVVTTYARFDPRKDLETSRTEASGTALARTITTTWHPTFRLPLTVTEPGRKSTYTYDAHGNVLTRTLTDTASMEARTWTYTYNANGRMLTEDGPRTDVTDVTTFAYYADNDADLGKRGNLASITDPLGHVTLIAAYDDGGTPTAIVDPNGLTLTLAFDARHRLVSTGAGGLVSTFQLRPTGDVGSVTMPDSRVLTFSYDSAQRSTGLGDNAGNAWSFTLDAMGNRTQDRLLDGTATVLATRSRTFSNAGRLTQEAGAAGQTTSYVYDGNGNATQRTDPLSRVTGYTYDALNRLIKMTLPGGTSVSLAYDARDRVTSFSDMRGLSSTFTYDGFDEVLTEKSPETGTTTYTYDLAGNVKTKTDAAGRTATLSYDALNRPVRIDYGDGTHESFLYDQGPSGIGRLTSVSDGAGGRAFGYDALGRVTRETISLSTSVATIALIVAYEYDPGGHLSAMTYPSGRKVTYSYDNLGQVSRVQSTSAGATTTLADLVTWRPFGAMMGFTEPSGARVARGYDSDGRISSYVVGGKTWNVAYDAASRITSIADAANAADARLYGYDVLDRLVSATTPVGAAAMTYDANGNRLTLVQGAVMQMASYAATSNRLLSTSGTTSRTYTYDASGAPLSDGTNTFVYDARGRLVQVTAGSAGVVHNLLSANGQRVGKQVDR